MINLLDKRVRSALAVGGIIAVALFGFAFRALWLPEGVVEVQEPAVGERHPLSGELLSAPMDERPLVYGVMVENHEEALPQAGVDEAFLVIEAPVEAAIPRWLAFFSSESNGERIGPIRSARPYYVSWNAELDGVYAHVGGSPESLDLLASDDTVDINEFANEEFFWRDHTREAPHNVYTSLELLSGAYRHFKNRFGAENPDYDSWQFKNKAEDVIPVASRIEVTFGYGDYAVAWVFDATANRYARLQNGRAHELEDATSIMADNLVVMEMEMTILDRIGRRRLETVGRGEARVYQDGQEIKGTWEKPSREARTRLYDEAGAEVFFNPGVTWIEVVPTLGDVEVDSTEDHG